MSQHHLIDKADDCLKHADITGSCIYATQASEHAPAADRKEDTVIIVLRGRQARRGRMAITALVDLITTSKDIKTN